VRRVVPQARIAADLPRVHHARVEREPRVEGHGQRAAEAHRHLLQRLDLALLERPRPGRPADARAVLDALSVARQRAVLRIAPMNRLWLAPLLFALACSGIGVQSSLTEGKAAAAQTAAPAAFHVAHRPPSAKDVIDAVIASASVPLSVSPTCANVGTEPTDT